MRWLSTLRGQFVAVVALAVIVSNLAVVLILENSRQGELAGARMEGLLQRAAGTVSFVASIPAAQRNEFARLISSPFMRAWITDAPVLSTATMTSSDLDLVRQMLASENNANGMLGIHVFAPRQEVPGPPPPRPQVDTPINDPVIVISQRLDTGQWLNMRFQRPEAPPRAPDILLAAAAATILTCAAAAWLAGRVSRPLSAIARAADEIAHGYEAPRLDARGPTDLKRAAEAFNAMSDRITRTLERQRHLLNAVGHDLRTPISAMRINAEFVPDAEVRERLSRNIDELQSLTEDVLSAARADSGEEMRRVDLAALVQSNCDDLSDLDQPVDADIEGPAPALCRSNDIRRATRNLIENAVRYAGGARVRLLLDPEFYVIAVEDNGPGIPEAHLEKVFEPFVRLEESRSNSTGGSGLGLTLARQIAREHGGDLILQNRPGGGLIAMLRLPRRAGDRLIVKREAAE